MPEKFQELFFMLSLREKASLYTYLVENKSVLCKRAYRLNMQNTFFFVKHNVIHGCLLYHATIKFLPFFSKIFLAPVPCKSKVFFCRTWFFEN